MKSLRLMSAYLVTGLFLTFSISGCIDDLTNSAPTVTDKAITTTANTPKTLTLNASDADGDFITYSIVTQPSHGTVLLNSPVVTYTPTTDYTGEDTFTFKANDGTADSNVGTVRVTINQ